MAAPWTRELMVVFGATGKQGEQLGQSGQGWGEEFDTRGEGNHQILMYFFFIFLSF